MCGRNTVAVTGRSVVLRRVSCRKSAMSHQFVVRPRNKTAVGPGRTSRRTSRRRSSTRHSTTPTARKIARAWWAATWLRACASEPILRCATALCLLGWTRVLARGEVRRLVAARPAFRNIHPCADQPISPIVDSPGGRAGRMSGGVGGGW